MKSYDAESADRGMLCSAPYCCTFTYSNRQQLRPYRRSAIVKRDMLHTQFGQESYRLAAGMTY